MKTRTNLKAWLTISVFLIGVGLVAQGVVVGDTFTVANTNDSGSGSLREAIISANANSGSDEITFSIPGTGPHTIQTVSELPQLNEEVVIDGYTQPGSEPATGASNAILKIVLDGSSEPTCYQGLELNENASNCVIKGLVISNYSHNGILIKSIAGGNVIEGNYIGTDYTGTIEQSNGHNGIFIGGSPNNIIGGTTPDAKNVISCNGHSGITIHQSAASGNEVLGNFIGTDVSGTSYLPNGGGVAIVNAPDNVIGGTAPGSRNVITNVSIANPGAMNNQVIGNYIGVNASGARLLNDYINTIGVIIKEASDNVIGPDNVISGHVRGVTIWANSSDNFVRGNYIGTDATGQVPIGFDWDGVTVNGSHNTIEDNVICASDAHGIYVAQPEGATTSHNILANNIIGMNATKDEALPNKNGIIINSAVNTTISGNLIAGNDYNGIGISNDFSWNPPGHFAVGNRITQNAIYDNGTLGINLAPGGVTPNDTGDTDTGPNHLMNYPVLTSAIPTPESLIVKGTIDTQDPGQVVLEFFANSAADATGYGEGETFLGTATPSAQGEFTVTLPAVSAGMWISATSTDPDNNTSEFALSIEAKSVEKSQLWIFPPVINRNRGDWQIMAILRLPKGITPDEINMDQKLLLYPGDIEAVRQYTVQSGRRRNRRTSIFAFFDKAALMEAVPDDGRVELQVVGQLNTGQYFYGNDTVRIVSRRPWWRPWWEQFLDQDD